MHVTTITIAIFALACLALIWAGRKDPDDKDHW
jgi:hypothetical protein